MIGYLRTLNAIQIPPAISASGTSVSKMPTAIFLTRSNTSADVIKVHVCYIRNVIYNRYPEIARSIREKHSLLFAVAGKHGSFITGALITKNSLPHGRVAQPISL